MTSLTRRFGSLVVLSAAGYVLSFCSQLVISYYFGTSPELDGYWAALGLVNFMCFYLHPLREALVPAVHRAAVSGMADAGKVLSAGLSFLGMLVIVSALLLFVFFNGFAFLMSMIGGGRSAVALVDLVLWLFPFMGLYVFTEALNGVLISLDRAVLQALARLATVAVFLAVLISFGASMGVTALLFGQLVGMTAGVGICVAALRAMRLRPVVNGFSVLRGSGVFPLFMALLTSYLFAQLYVLGERTAMIHLSEGLVSAYQYSTSLVNMLISMLAYPLANVLWPRFLASGQAGEASEAGVLAGRTAAVLFLTLFIVCTFVWTHAEQVVFLLFNRGAFGTESAAQTVSALQATIFAAIPIGVMAILGRLLISFGNGRSQVHTGFAITVVGLSVIGVSVWLHSVALVQWHWLAANVAGLLVSLFAYSRQCGLSRSALMKGSGWTAIIVIAVCSAAFLTPHFETGGDKLFTCAALALEGTIFLLIAGAIAWACGAMRLLQMILR